MSQTSEEYILIPKDKLTDEIFKNIIEEFILREGTDYGHASPSLEEKRNRVINQIESGHVCIVFSTLTEDCTLLTKAEFQKMTRSLE